MKPEGPGLRRYYVSQDGRVLTVTTKKPRLMKPYWTKALGGTHGQFILKGL